MVPSTLQKHHHLSFTLFNDNDTTHIGRDEPQHISKGPVHQGLVAGCGAKTDEIHAGITAAAQFTGSYHARGARV